MINLKKILVPVDFSEGSRKALTYGLSLCNNYKAALHLFNAIDDRIYDDSLFMLYAEQEVRQTRQRITDEQLDKLTAEIKGTHPQLEVIKVIRLGIGFVEIVKYAQEQGIDLIIMGSHGHTGIAHLLIGSTTEKVVRKAPCPVLTVRPKEHEFVVAEGK